MKNVCLFTFYKYLLQLFIILIVLCSILHYASHTILLLIIKISIFLFEKIIRKDGSYFYRMSTSALKIIVQIQEDSNTSGVN